MTILFVSHSAALGGAQKSLVEVVRWVKEHTSARVRVLVLDGGPLLGEFEELGGTIQLPKIPGGSAASKVRFIEEFCGGKPDLVYVNSLVSASATDLIGRVGAPVVTHVHELEAAVAKYSGSEDARGLIDLSARLIAPSQAVREHLVEEYGVAPEDCTVVSGPIPALEISEGGARAGEAKAEARRDLGLPADGFVVVGCGVHSAFRKGADFFIDVALALRRRIAEGWHFYWVGDLDPADWHPERGRWDEYRRRVASERLDGHLTFLGTRVDPRRYMQAGEVFVLTSREDPFPLAMLEAAQCGLPIVCFDGSGG